jgi:hypothetical protein
VNWREKDARWFRKHPRRSHRLRTPISGEWAEYPPVSQEGLAPLTLVRQIAPGARMRLPVFARPDAVIPDDEHFLHALFDELLIAQGREPTRLAVHARAAAYAAAETHVN